ncbi:ABC transporter permease [Mycetocola tolaasinivorans]|uniref:ABC transporter permease n=1 Tax=Mycetocola tolaasinivorans TaxID=76635 RepID=A0A3L7AF03_9MICO|nr:FtsX-like permease family protein [Mycetocola tolaasinivorans]RLP77972.1 ABC transporter permease [Mycetocola tolaasinivorans]
MSALPKSRLRTGDLFALGLHGVRVHPMRAALSALGIAIGIAAMIAVIGISTSSQAAVREKLAALGTNLLTMSAGKDLLGADTKLPPDAGTRVLRIDGVETSGWTTEIDYHVYRNDLTLPGETGGLRVRVAGGDLLATTGTALASGRWFNAETEKHDLVVLGAGAAEAMGITEPGNQVWLGGQYFTVLGILQPSLLTPELDSSALVGAGIAAERFGFDGSPTVLYERSSEERVPEVRDLLPATINPEAPNEVSVSRPSDALAAKNTVDQAFTGLLIGVGSIALLVGGIGVANTMVITVLERRREIGLRRSLGATRANIRNQFLMEAVLLALLGGLVGAGTGFAVTAIVAASNGWKLEVPVSVLIAGVLATVAVGAVAGVLPALRAARTSPAVALSS